MTPESGALFGGSLRSSNHMLLRLGHDEEGASEPSTDEAAEAAALVDEVMTEARWRRVLGRVRERLAVGADGFPAYFASRPRWPEGSDERMGARTVVSTSRFNFSFPGAKRGLLGLERSFPLPISISRFRGQKRACQRAHCGRS